MTTKDYIIATIKAHKHEIQLFGVKNVGLFGSYVRNEQSEKSDIDLLVDFAPNEENFDNFMGICDYFEKLFKNQKVDIVTKNGLSQYIGPTILKEVLYA